MKKILLLSLLLFSAASFANTAEVFQREYISTTSSEFDQIQTGGLNTCVGVVIHQKNSTKTVLAHIDAGVDPERAIDTLLSSFNDKNNLRSWVYGGIKKSSLQTYEKILDELERNNIPVIAKEQNRSSSSSTSIRFDLKKGELILNNNIYVEIPYNVRQGKMDRIKFERRLFRHEGSLGGGDDPLQYYVEQNDIGGPFNPFNF